MSYKTRPDAWSVADLRAYAENKQIKIPSFQRRLRWSEEKKKALLNSIDQGLPIGTLLVHESPGKPYLLVDGLQRVTAIIEAAQQPYSYLSPEAVAEDGFKRFSIELKITTGLDAQGKLTKTIESWLNHAKPNSVIATNELQENIAALYPDIATNHIALFVSEIAEVAERFVTQREQYPIPLIRYTGAISDLPEIFERLNQLGTKLTKYEIYMATWENEGLITPGDPTAADQVLDRFEAAEEYGIQVENQHPGKLTLGEYLLTLGHEVCNKRPRLFGTGYEETADSIGFQAACLAMGLPLAGMENLHKHMNELFYKEESGTSQPPHYIEEPKNGFWAGILQAADFWEEVLAATRWDKAGHSVPHGSLVSTAMVVAALVEANSNTDKPQGSWAPPAHWPRSKDANNVHTIALRRYIMALLSPELTRQYGKIQDLVWADGTNAAGQRIPSRWFFTEPTKGQLLVFDSWWSTQLQKGMGRNVSSLQKTLLAVVTKTVQPERGIPYGKQEVDHVISWNKVAQQNWQSAHPVSSVANLCILDKQTNGALKSAGSLNSLLSHPDIVGRNEDNAKRRAMIESNVFLSNQELRKTLLELDATIYSDSIESEAAFRQFLNLRWEAIKGHLIGSR
jgi:hypothetical protein